MRLGRPRVTLDPAAPMVVLSPHFDDAVLNCWSLLTGSHPPVVVNVFTGTPPTRVPGEWDRLCGASDAVVHMGARRAEDAEVLGRTGSKPVNLDLVERQYRSRLMRPLLRRIDMALARVMPALSRVFAPLGVHHPDHKLTRRYALQLHAAGIPVSLYAEVPHGVPHGWPEWVSGSPPRPHLKPDLLWEPVLSRLGSEAPQARVVRLDEAQSQAKLAALRGYETQFAALDRGSVEVLSGSRIRGFEVFWDLRAGGDPRTA